MRRPMPRALVTGGIAVALTCTACGGPSASPPPEQPATTAAGETSTSAGPFAEVDPCGLLDPSAGVPGPGEREDKLGSLVCRWEVPEGGVAVNLHPDRAVEQLDLSQYQVSETTVGDRPAKLARGAEGDGTCEVLLPVSGTASAGVAAITDDMNNDTACAVAQRLAPVVAEKLPAG